MATLRLSHTSVIMVIIILLIGTMYNHQQMTYIASSSSYIIINFPFKFDHAFSCSKPGRPPHDHDSLTIPSRQAAIVEAMDAALRHVRDFLQLPWATGGPGMGCSLYTQQCQTESQREVGNEW